MTTDGVHAAKHRPETPSPAEGLASLLPPAGPQRVLTGAYFVDSIGSGLYAATSAIFFTRSVGLSATEAGVGLTLGSLLGILVAAPAGHLADRLGPREVFLANMLLSAGCMALSATVRRFPAFVVVVCLGSAVTAASQATRGPLVRAYGGTEPVRLRSHLRSVTHLGLALVALLAGVALRFDSRPVYLALILANAVSFLGCAALARRLSHVPVVPVSKESGRRLALQDRGFLAIAILNGVMALHYAILTYALPLWIVQRTAAPRWLVAVPMVVNTVLVVSCQVRASRRVDTPRGAGWAVTRAGVAVLGGAALTAAAAGLPVVLAAVGVIAGTAVYTFGELGHSAAAFELGFGFAPAHAQGQYAGVFSIGQGIATAAAPSLLGVLCISWGTPGRLLFGALMATTGAAAVRVVGWAERRQGEGEVP